MNSGELVLGSQKLDLSLVISAYSVVSESSKGYGEAGEQIRFDFTMCVFTLAYSRVQPTR